MFAPLHKQAQAHRAGVRRHDKTCVSDRKKKANEKRKFMRKPRKKKKKRTRKKTGRKNRKNHF